MALKHAVVVLDVILVNQGFSEQSRAQWHIMLRHAECHSAVGIMETSDKALRHDRTDLLRRKINDGHDKPADKAVWLVERSDLCA